MYGVIGDGFAFISTVNRDDARVKMCSYGCCSQGPMTSRKDLSVGDLE